MNKIRDIRAIAAISITLLLWASSFVVIRYEVAYFTPGALALGRLTIGAIALGVVLLARRGGLVGRKAWPGTVVSGIFWFGLFTVTLITGERYVDPGTAALLVGAMPLLTTLFSGFILKEGYSLRFFAGLAISVAGTLVIGLSTVDGNTTWQGAVLCLVAAVGGAVGLTAQKSSLKYASPLPVTTLACAVGAVACTPFAGQLAAGLRTAPGAAVFGVFYLGLIPTAVAYYTWTYALSRTKAGNIATSTYLIPVLVVLLSWALLGEVPALLALLGGGLSIVGLAVSKSH